MSLQKTIFKRKLIFVFYSTFFFIGFKYDIGPKVLKKLTITGKAIHNILTLIG